MLAGQESIDPFELSSRNRIILNLRAQRGETLIEGHVPQSNPGGDKKRQGTEELTKRTNQKNWLVLPVARDESILLIVPECIAPLAPDAARYMKSTEIENQRHKSTKATRINQDMNEIQERDISKIQAHDIQPNTQPNVTRPLLTPNLHREQKENIVK